MKSSHSSDGEKNTTKRVIFDPYLTWWPRKWFTMSTDQMRLFIVQRPLFWRIVMGTVGWSLFLLWMYKHDIPVVDFLIECFKTWTVWTFEPKVDPSSVPQFNF